MSLVTKIQDLCKFHGMTITKLENDLGYGHGSIPKQSPGNVRSDRVQEIAKYFNVTPTYLMTDMIYCVCPTCGVAYNPVDKGDLETHSVLHDRFVNLRNKMGYLLNPSQAATKRAVAQAHLESGDFDEEGKGVHYETLIRCDYAEHAYFNNYIIDIEYPDFVKQQLRLKKYFEYLNPQQIRSIYAIYGLDPSQDDEEAPIMEQFKKDKTFMANITDLWDLPEALRYDVYKAIRHAKRDYADKEYYTNPYANISDHCDDTYDPSSEKCRSCRKETNK